MKMSAFQSSGDGVKAWCEADKEGDARGGRLRAMRQAKEVLDQDLAMDWLSTSLPMDLLKQCCSDAFACIKAAGEHMLGSNVSALNELTKKLELKAGGGKDGASWLTGIAVGANCLSVAAHAATAFVDINDKELEKLCNDCAEAMSHRK